jgi:hypothetical protein
MNIDGSFLHRWRTAGCGWFAAIDYYYRDVTQKPTTPNNRVDTLIRYGGVNLPSQSLTPFFFSRRLLLGSKWKRNWMMTSSRPAAAAAVPFQIF